MTPTLTPALALAYLRELSADVRGGAVLDAAGAALAGDDELRAPAAAFVAAMGGAGAAEARNARGAVFAVRAPELSVVLVCGPRALGGLTRHDLRLVLADLGASRPTGAEEPVPLPGALAEALVSAAQRGPGA